MLTTKKRNQSDKLSFSSATVTPTTTSIANGIGVVNQMVSTTGVTHFLMLKFDPKFGITQTIITPKKDEIINALKPTSEEIFAIKQIEKKSINKHKERMELTKWRGRGIFATIILDWLKKKFLPIET